MTTLTRTELSNIYTTDTQAPIVDGLGNPRFINEHEMTLDSDPLYGLAIAEIDAVIDDYNDDLASWQEDTRDEGFYYSGSGEWSEDTSYEDYLNSGR